MTVTIETSGIQEVEQLLVLLKTLKTSSLNHISLNSLLK